FRMIPGLEHAEFVRLGSLHRNTFVNAPALLLPSLQVIGRRRLLLAGQIVGVEGYVESAATGLLAGLNIARLLRGDAPLAPPRTTALGSLLGYITHRGKKAFQPMNANYGLFPPVSGSLRGREKQLALAGRAGAERVWAFATAAVRRAGDGAAFAREVGRAASVPVEVLSGVREAALAYAAVAHGLPGLAGPLLVVDVGGGTTEITLGRDETVLETASLPLGALTLSEAGAGRVAECVEPVLAGCDLLARAATSGARLAASGGTATALAALDLGLTGYDARRVHGHVLGRAALEALVARVAALPAA